MKTYYDIPTQVVFYDGGDESPIFLHRHCLQG